MERVLSHYSGAENFEVARRCFGYLCTPVLSLYSSRIYRDQASYSHKTCTS